MTATRNRLISCAALALVLAGCAATAPPGPEPLRWAHLAGCPLAYPDGQPAPCQSTALAAAVAAPSPIDLCQPSHSGEGWSYVLVADDRTQRYAIRSTLDPGLQLVAAIGNEGPPAVVHHKHGAWESWFEADAPQPIDLQVIVFSETIRLEAPGSPSQVEPVWSAYQGSPWVSYVVPGDPPHALQRWVNLTLLFGVARPISWPSFNLTGADFTFHVERKNLWMEGGAIAPIPLTSIHAATPCAASPLLDP